ncbi:PaaI family thioesterase [Oceanobacillus rekensis]|uniref:PaaI family thioesterase n=1 Tax=Oceanobacillus rekensis TaxID=937927 RepID=UPI000B4324CF|nr:PaaI family thioesterase [Oceanobacillus rekensis]
MNNHLENARQDFEQSAYWNFIGLSLNELNEGFASLTLPILPSFLNVRNTVHGGIYFSIMDTTMGLASRSLGYDEVVTIQLNTQFIKPAVDGVLISEATIISKSRSTALVEGKLFDGNGNLIAHSTGTFKLTKMVEQ